MNSFYFTGINFVMFSLGKNLCFMRSLRVIMIEVLGLLSVSISTQTLSCQYELESSITIFHFH